MLNSDSTLHSSIKNLMRYEKEAIDAERLLDRQFAPSIIEYLETFVSGRHILIPDKRPVLKKRISILTEEDPKRVLAWAIAQRVREARERQDLRQEDVAKMTGIARPNIVRIEQGRHVPSLATLRKIADALHLEISSLTAEPEVTVKDRMEFAEMAESGIERWEKALEEEDNRD